MSDDRLAEIKVELDDGYAVGHKDVRWLVAELEAARTLVEEFADVLPRMVIGWESKLGVDLAQHPDVQTVMAHYRKSVGRD